MKTNIDPEKHVCTAIIDYGTICNKRVVASRVKLFDLNRGYVVFLCDEHYNDLKLDFSKV